MINGLIEGSTGNTRQANVARVTKLPATSLYIAARPSAWVIVRQRAEKVFRWVNQTYVYHVLEFRPSSLTTFVGHLTHFWLEGVGQPLSPKTLLHTRLPWQGSNPRYL